MGDVSRNMTRVVELISSRIGEIERSSKIYKTEAWGFDTNDIFQNQVLILNTNIDPVQLLEQTQGIEREFGKRVGKMEFNDRGERVYHSREMDIDILFYDDVVVESETLTIPHALLHIRDFVLNPLSEVMGEFVHPKLKMSINVIKERYEQQNL